MEKRTFDIVVSFFGLIILFPIIVIIWLLIALIDGRPIIFRQKRIGRYGKLFTIYKFRTMKDGVPGNSISVKGEQRITKIGSYLRKFKLDELPELWNVFIGDMSFVGPRPDMPEYLNMLDDDSRVILKLRPGITGPASLKYANEEELLVSVKNPKLYNDNVIWPDKVRINVKYYYNKSFFGDITIILKTIFRKY